MSRKRKLGGNEEDESKTVLELEKEGMELMIEYVYSVNLSGIVQDYVGRLSDLFCWQVLNLLLSASGATKHGEQGSFLFYDRSISGEEFCLDIPNLMRQPIKDPIIINRLKRRLREQEDLMDWMLDNKYPDGSFSNFSEKRIESILQSCMEEVLEKIVQGSGELVVTEHDGMLRLVEVLWEELLIKEPLASDDVLKIRLILNDFPVNDRTNFSKHYYSGIIQNIQPITADRIICAVGELSFCQQHCKLEKLQVDPKTITFNPKNKMLTLPIEAT